jgi:uncharacterized DUF497 family protein
MKLIVRRLHWDRQNEARVAEHRVTPAEVEALCQGDPLALRSAVDRLIVIGSTRAGRDLTVVLAPLAADTYEVVTARPATRRERRHLQAAATLDAGTARGPATTRAPRIPTIDDRADEAGWWDGHDLADYLDELQPIDLHLARQLAPPRLGVDDLLTRRVGRGAPGAVRTWLQDRLDRLRDLERRRRS